MSYIMGWVMYSAAATDRCTNAVRGAQLGVNKEGRAAAHTRVLSSATLRFSRRICSE
jgi:hypothetical protein